MPTLARNGRSQLTVGIQLNGGQRFWANCVDVPAASRVGETAVFDPIQAANQIQQVVVPLWQGQPAAEFRPLAHMLLPLTETFTYNKITPPRPKPVTGAVSRRSLITGFLAEETPPAPKEETVTVKRPLHPALQYGLTVALLQAVAAVNRETVAALVAREYALDWVDTAVPLHIALNDENIQTASAILATHVAALGYTTGENNHKNTLGANAERLQHHLRQVAAWLPTLNSDFQPMLHLDLRDSFGELFNNDEGKVLGALAGLEQAVKPFKLAVQNPVWQNGREAQQKSLQKLVGYFAIRRMTPWLVADAWVDSPEDAAHFANPKVCHMVHIELPRLGNLEGAITAVLHLKSQNQPLLLSGEAAALTTHIALALRPTWLSGPPQLHYNEMQKLHQP